MLNLRKNIFVKIILYPLSIIYGMSTDLRNWLFDKGIFRQSTYPVPVISVGNITAGGTGKTPFTMLLIELLSPHYSKIVVVSRGYGRKSKGLKIVSDSRQILVPVEKSGDEPFLIAQKYPAVPVIVSEKRALGIETAVKDYGAEIILLDDAFQHRKVQRDCDIVLINSEKNISLEKVLPLGNLRERLKHLQRANIIVYTGSERDEAHQNDSNIESEIKFRCLFKSESIVDTNLHKIGDLSILKGKRGIAFAAIANPENFQRTLEVNDLQIKKMLTFPDHHFYTEADHRLLAEELRVNQADYLITTEKDLVRVDVSYLKEIKVIGIKRIGVLTNQEEFKNKLKEYVDFKM